MGNLRIIRSLRETYMQPARRFGVLFVCGLVLLLPGCASLTNPVKNGVPASCLPPHLQAESKEGYASVPMNLFRQPAGQQYKIASGDVLSVYIAGVLDEKNPLPTFNTPERTRQEPERRNLISVVGYPVTVRSDGTIDLPQTKPIYVSGKTIMETTEAIRKAYTEDAKILQPGKDRIVVNLLNKRLVHVIVFRQDLAERAENVVQQTRVGLFSGGAELLGVGTTAKGHEITLPAYENDLLHALALTGGFPGTNANREILIYRDWIDPIELKAKLGAPLKPNVQIEFDGNDLPPAHFNRVIRIPLRARIGEDVTIDPKDVTLQDGDAIWVRSAPVTTFYTGGLLPPAEHVLPRDYDLDVLEAVTRVRGPLVNGAFGGSNLSGQLIQPGIGNPNPRLLTVVRKTPDGGQLPIIVDLNRALVDPRERILVKPGDVLVLQETPRQSLVRYFTDTVQFSGFFRLLNRRDALATAAFIVP